MPPGKPRLQLHLSSLVALAVGAGLGMYANMTLIDQLDAENTGSKVPSVLFVNVVVILPLVALFVAYVKLFVDRWLWHREESRKPNSDPTEKPEDAKDSH